MRPSRKEGSLKSLKQRKSRKFGSYIGIVVAIALIAFGAIGLLWQYKMTHQPNVQINTEVVTHSTDKPDETPPEKCADVPHNIPRQIELPDINASGCIQKVGVDQNHAIAVPNNVHVAGWYVDSSVPGEKGVSIIDGHVSGIYSEGIFKHIAKLRTGNKIEVQFGDGSQRTFTVKTVDSYSVDQTSKEQYKQLNGVESQLTLITCGGRFDAKTKQFDKRIVVRAELS